MEIFKTHDVAEGSISTHFEIVFISTNWKLKKKDFLKVNLYNLIWMAYRSFHSVKNDESLFVGNKFRKEKRKSVKEKRKEGNQE